MLPSPSTRRFFHQVLVHLLNRTSPRRCTPESNRTIGSWFRQTDDPISGQRTASQILSCTGRLALRTTDKGPTSRTLAILTSYLLLPLRQRIQPVEPFQTDLATGLELFKLVIGFRKAFLFHGGNDTIWLIMIVLSLVLRLIQILSKYHPLQGRALHKYY